MSLVIDAGPIVALGMGDDPRADKIEDILNRETGPLVIPAQITAEIDYLLRERVGVTARRAFLADLASGRFVVHALDLADYALVVRHNQQYADLDVGLSDLAVVVTAHRLRTNRILTFDQRHVRAMKPIDGGSFTILPADRS